MDLTTTNEGAYNGKRATTPKHGKNPENRLWSKTRRGDGKKEREDGGINPDGALDVATVCGNEVRTYSAVKHGRRLIRVIQFPHRGAALMYAHEFEEIQRRPPPVRVPRTA